MEKIFSKQQPDRLLHIVVRKSDLIPGRVEVVPEENFIQCAVLNMQKGKTFLPHKHIWKERTRNIIAQESWIVVQGSVRCVFYDLDDQVIAEPVLYPEELPYLKGDSTRIRELGWKPEYTFESMMDEMIDFWMEILQK